jgi:hypothetical protein
MPRKLICVAGEESRLPGSGDTVTAPARRAEAFSREGVHLGATPPACAEAVASAHAANPRSAAAFARVRDSASAFHRG